MLGWIKLIFHGIVATVISGLAVIGIHNLGTNSVPTPQATTTQIISSPTQIVGATTSAESAEIAKLQQALAEEKAAQAQLEKQINSVSQKNTSTPPPTIVNNSNNSNNTTTKQTDNQTLSGSQIVSLLAPAVALITSSTGAGSGFVIDNGRYILTNQHVVGKDTTVKVSLPTMSFNAPVLGTNSSVDVALIYSGDHSLPAAVTLGSSDSTSLPLGEDIYTLGYPLSISEGLTNLTFQKGILSARQTPTWANQQLLQTDAAINHGNSGGPLVNNKGEVVGINTYTDAFGQTQGIYFAIPIDTIKTYIPILSDYGQSRYEVYPIGSTLSIPASVLLQIQLNGTLTCSELGLTDNNLTLCNLFRDYPNDYHWNTIKDQ